MQYEIQYDANGTILSAAYSLTPEQYVEEMRTNGEVLHITKGNCKECFCTPDRYLVTEVMRAEMERDLVPYQCTMECQCTAGANFLRKRSWGRDFPDLPEYVCCYGYYYQHFHENIYMQALHVANLVSFYDVSTLPGLREMGLLVWEPQWWIAFGE